MKNIFKSVFHLILMTLILFTNAVLAQSDFIYQNDFEKNQDKWEPHGSSSVSLTKDEAANGVKSLKVSGRSANWHGAHLSVTKLLTPGETYRFTASVKLLKGFQPDEIKLTMQRGENQYQQVATGTVSADEWRTLTGIYKVPNGKDSLLFYIEAGRGNTSYVIDDFKIEKGEISLPKQSGTILQNDFEDMTGQNWITRGDGVQMFSSNAGGSQSLKVGNRTAPWHGLALDVSSIFYKGRTYQVFVSVRLVKGQSPDNLRVTVQITPPQGEAKYINITNPTKVTDSEWVALTGEFTGTTDDSKLLLYVEAEGATTSFFIDNFVIKTP
jgi:endo-1,4-beta-xylanase